MTRANEDARSRGSSTCESPGESMSHLTIQVSKSAKCGGAIVIRPPLCVPSPSASRALLTSDHGAVRLTRALPPNTAGTAFESIRRCLGLAEMPMLARAQADPAVTAYLETLLGNAACTPGNVVPQAHSDRRDCGYAHRVLTAPRP